MGLYWIGVRESELVGTCDLFSGSITVYGTNKNNNYSFDKRYNLRFNCNYEYQDWIIFVNEIAALVIKNDPQCKFLLYYPADYPYYSDEIKSRVICLNDIKIISFLENKILTKLWLSNYVSTSPFVVLSGEQIVQSKHVHNFENTDTFVVQDCNSCGGSGTWLLDKDTESTINQKLVLSKRYIVSPYFKYSVPVNIHLIISDSEILLLPPSIQIISTEQNTFSYCGADYIAYHQISSEKQKSLLKQAKIIGEKLKSIGYLGVCGIDFIITKENIYFMEINSRFQASTMAINRALLDAGIHTSIHNLHIKAFENNIPKAKELCNLEVNYSFHYYQFDPENLNKLKYLHSLKENHHKNIFFVDDDLDWKMNFEKDTYLFELLFNTNIVAINSEFKCVIEQNTEINSGIIKLENIFSDMLAFKIMLFNHGVRLTEKARSFTECNGGLNYVEFGAVDMMVNNLYINVPYQTKNSTISPFEVDVIDGRFVLNYFGEFIATIKLRGYNKIGKNLISDNFICDDITYLGNDRLRIYHRHSCFFKNNNLACKFCDIDQDNRILHYEDIVSAIDKYWDNAQINHYLIGGGSECPSSDFSNIIKVSNYIKSKTNKPISIMSIPPYNLNILDELKNAGITEVVFNLEVYDRVLAKKYMPGKGNISLDVYVNAFKKAVSLWGNTGNVRTMFILGLEPTKSLLKGIEFVCKLGVSPTLSLFKPIPETEMENYLPPSNIEIYQICKKAIEICESYGVQFGPHCKYCEDNVLKVSNIKG